MLIPGENMWSQSARGGLYLFCLLYVFLGVAIVADVFMNAIEVVTSATKTVSPSSRHRAEGGRTHRGGGARRCSKHVIDAVGVSLVCTHHALRW
jgi:hypothetical protein